MASGSPRTERSGRSAHALSDRRPGILGALDPAFVIGALCTVVFYAIIHQPSMRGSMLHLYTTEHIVEYVIVSLFLWGLVDLAFKMLALPRQFMALKQDWLPLRVHREPVSNARQLLAGIREKPRWMQESRIGRRLTQALEYVAERGSTEDYREYLQYLSEQGENTTHSNYMLIRFVSGVTPLLGFLGTVVHFGTALSGISFDEMATKLPIIASEMGQAFNTTTVALGTAMTMTVSLFIGERLEKSIDRSIDRITEHELMTRFVDKDPNIAPLLSSVQSASDEALSKMSETLDRQVDLWSASLDRLFEQFADRHRQETQGWAAALDLLAERHEQNDAAREQRLMEIMKLIESGQDQHLARIQKVMERAVDLRDDFAHVVETMNEIAKGEGKLVELQTSLGDNLRVLRETQQIDEALHGLTAAIHLLTTRHGTPGRAAA